MTIQETWVNRTENYSSGESDFYETFTDDTGILFKSLQQEHGRCISKMYRDIMCTNEGPAPARHIGWVFEKLKKYDDSPERFLCHTWVEIRR